MSGVAGQKPDNTARLSPVGAKENTNEGHASRLSGIDLNQLLALDALLREGSVTRAARRVGLSQPAMSHALARLRVQFADPLLVRAGKRMQPTPRARALAAPLRDALARLESALGEPAPFHPERAEGTLRIAAVDFSMLVLVPALCAVLAREAPGITVSVVAPVEQLDRALVDGETDLHLGLRRPAEGLFQRDLLTERFVCVVRRDHPEVGRSLNLRQFTRLPHALISPHGTKTGAVDVALARRGLSRRVQVVMPNFHAAALLVARSDMVLTVSERVARTAPRRGPLRILRPPLPLDGFTVTMRWHARTDADPLHAWVRQRLLAIARTV